MKEKAQYCFEDTFCAKGPIVARITAIHAGTIYVMTLFSSQALPTRFFTIVAKFTITTFCKI